MSTRQRYRAIILRTIDIGEGDRLCIILTREKGRMAARAKSVRKLHSKMGAMLLPFRSLHIDLHEGKSNVITSAAPDENANIPTEFHAFMRLQQAVDLILSFTHEEEPLPEIFDLLIQQLHYCNLREINTTPAFTLRLLYLLGLLPTTPDDARFRRLPKELQDYVVRVPLQPHIALLSTPESDHPTLKLFIDAIVTGDLNRPLATTQVVEDLREEWRKEQN